jgi:hypothetical protein
MCPLYRVTMHTIYRSGLPEISFAGDQLTAARAQQAIESRINSKDQLESLRGLVPFACDWHAKANFMLVSVVQ